MIFDTLDNYEEYVLLNKNLKAGFEFLKNNNLKELKDGTYKIKDNEVYANVQTLETKQKDLKKWEAHRKYIVIQYVIKGEECMGFGLRKDFREVEKEYDSEKDVEFLAGQNFNYIDVKEGNFVVFYPGDVHAPMLSVDKNTEIKKVIVKVAVSTK